eukprot:666694-Amphidinium_carterae.1
MRRKVSAVSVVPEKVTRPPLTSATEASSLECLGCISCECLEVYVHIPQSLRRLFCRFFSKRLLFEACLASVVLFVFVDKWGLCDASLDEVYFEDGFRHPRSWWLGGDSSHNSAIINAVSVAFGAATRIASFCSMRRHRRRGALVFVISAIATLARSVILDEHYLNEPRVYSIYRTPSACDAQLNPVSSWVGPDDVEHCIYNSTSWREATVYVATSSNEYSPSCAAFSADSAVLDLWDCKERLGEVVCTLSRPITHEHLCGPLGWVIGGKFGAVYRLAAFMNIITDIEVMILFASGRRDLIAFGLLACLILLQLALLLPVAHFSHGGCLHVTNPLGLKLHIAQDAVHALGSSVQSWGRALVLILICA